MSGGLWARVKTWISGETVLAADINAEFDNIKSNLDLATLDDLSSNITAMQQTFDPGDLGTESQPTNAAEENKALRSLIKKITGEDQWYIPPVNTITALNDAIPSTGPKNSVTSGLVDSNNQPQFLVPDGVALELDIKATATDLVYRIEGAEYSKDTDETKTMTAANGFAANNTATFNGGVVTENETLGEDVGSVIMLAATGSEISSRVGEMMIFKTTNGADTEYFMARIVDWSNVGTTYALVDVSRGFLFGSTGASQRVVLAAAQVIEMLQPAWIFAKKDSSIHFSKVEPYVSGEEPSSPSANDYWYDLVNEIWMLHDGADFNDAEATLIGISGQDSGVCECARPLEFYADRKAICTISLKKKVQESTVIYGNRVGGVVDINGTVLDYQKTIPKWDLNTDRDAGVSLSDGVVYYLYITHDFKHKISDLKPHNRTTDLKGWFHPYKPWRAIGFAYYHSSSHLFGDVVPHTYGADSNISDRSITTDKLAPYMTISEDGGHQANTYDNVAVNLAAVGTTDPCTINARGRRPILIIFQSLSTDSSAFNNTVRLDIEVKDLNTTGGAWTGITRVIDMGTANLIPITGFSYLYMPLTGGKMQFRLNLITATGFVALKGSLIAIEL